MYCVYVRAMSVLMDFLILAHHVLGFQNSPYWWDQQRYLLYRINLSQDTG